MRARSRTGKLAGADHSPLLREGVVRRCEPGANLRLPPSSAGSKPARPLRGSSTHRRGAARALLRVEPGICSAATASRKAGSARRRRRAKNLPMALSPSIRLPLYVAPVVKHKYAMHHIILKYLMKPLYITSCYADGHKSPLNFGLIAGVSMSPDRSRSRNPPKNSRPETHSRRPTPTGAARRRRCSRHRSGIGHHRRFPHPLKTSL
jgi:hypothetical protein